jgi:arginyl-tRNA synthetase
MIREEIEKIIKDEVGEKVALETPPDVKFGDYAWPCFDLKDKEEVASKLVKNELFSDVKVVGGYINFFVKPEKLFGSILEGVDEKYGEGDSGKGKELVLEYSSPNTNKPQHIGHLRNNFLGDSLARIFKSQGFKVNKVQIINDRGIHIMKSLLMYMKKGEGKTPLDLKMKGDHFVGHFYNMYEDSYEEEARELLRKWEGGDKEVRKVWKVLNDWVYEGWEETYKDQGISFDKLYYESEIYDKGKEIVLESPVFSKNEDGSIEVDLTDDGLDKKIVLRADGTSIYITQDLYLAELRAKDYPKASKFLYVVDHAQQYHFKALFATLGKLGFKKNLAQVWYGQVKLGEGEKMSSRLGNAVDADELVGDVLKLAKKREIGLGALRYYILHIDPKKDIVYDSGKALGFLGNTGPYIMYAYARGKSILRKSDNGKVDYSSLGEVLERELVLLIEKFPLVVKRASLEYDPALVANYLYELAQVFSSFYHKLVAKDNPDRVKLVEGVCQTLKNGCSMLGINVLEEM